MIARPLTLAAATLALAAPAAGASSIADDIAAAHDYWRTDVCRGQWQIAPDATLPLRGHAGEATGIGFRWNGAGWDWFIERCVFTMDPGIEGCDRRRVVRHEIGHFVHGPRHDGPMAGVDGVPCEPAPAAARTVRAARTKRTRSSRRAMRVRVLKRWRAEGLA